MLRPFLLIRNFEERKLFRPMLIIFDKLPA
jgi:hypothetical protein